MAAIKLKERGIVVRMQRNKSDWKGVSRKEAHVCIGMWECWKQILQKLTQYLKELYCQRVH